MDSLYTYDMNLLHYQYNPEKFYIYILIYQGTLINPVHIHVFFVLKERLQKCYDFITYRILEYIDGIKMIFSDLFHPCHSFSLRLKYFVVAEDLQCQRIWYVCIITYINYICTYI